MDVVISEPTAGRAYQKKVDNPAIFLNKKVGDEVPLDSIGLSGYVGKITGGSDMEGFPMKHDLPGMARRNVFITKKRGMRIRARMRGNAVGEHIAQLNIKIVKAGQKKIEELIEVKKKEKTESEKERVLRELKEGKGQKK